MATRISWLQLRDNCFDMTWCLTYDITIIWYHMINVTWSQPLKRSPYLSYCLHVKDQRGGVRSKPCWWKMAAERVGSVGAAWLGWILGERWFGMFDLLLLNWCVRCTLVELCVRYSLVELMCQVYSCWTDVSAHSCVLLFNWCVRSTLVELMCQV